MPILNISKIFGIRLMTNLKDQAEHQAKQDIRNDEIGKKNALADVPPEFSVNNRDSDLGSNSNKSNSDKSNTTDPTDAGYDEAVKHDPEGGFAVADVDDMLETERENAIGGVPTLTPSPTARDDEDPTALDESNVAGEAPTQSM